MKFSIEKYSFLLMNKGKTNNGKNRTTKSGKNQKKTNRWEYSKLIPSNGDKRKSKKGILPKNKETIETKICGRNFMKGINTCDSSLIRY